MAEIVIGVIVGIILIITHLKYDFNPYGFDIEKLHPESEKDHKFIIIAILRNPFGDIKKERLHCEIYDDEATAVQRARFLESKMKRT